MLGKLTRWLRLAGEDVVCVNDYSIPPEKEDQFLLEKAEKDTRILITRDTELYRMAVRKNLRTILLEEKENIAKQLAKISEYLGEDISINPEESRCPVCNGELEPLEKTEILEKVPETVLQKNEKFWKCKKCDKIYWPGGHWKKITETVKKYEKIKG